MPTVTVINPIPRSHDEAARTVEHAVGQWLPIAVVLGLVYYGSKIAISQVPAIEGLLSTRIQGAGGPNILNGQPSAINSTLTVLPGPNPVVNPTTITPAPTPTPTPNPCPSGFQFQAIPFGAGSLPSGAYAVTGGACFPTGTAPTTGGTPQWSVPYDVNNGSTWPTFNGRTIGYPAPGQPLVAGQAINPGTPNPWPSLLGTNSPR